VQVGVSGGRREPVDGCDVLNNSVSTVLTVSLRTSTGKVLSINAYCVRVVKTCLLYFCACS